MDIKIYLTKIINSNLLKSTKFFSTINFDWNGLWRCWFLFLIKKITNNIILMDASLKVQCGKCRLTHHKLRHLFTPMSNINFFPLSGIVLVNLLKKQHTFKNYFWVLQNFLRSKNSSDENFVEGKICVAQYVTFAPNYNFFFHHVYRIQGHW